MSVNNELCWTCKNLDGGKCPVKVQVKKASKFNGVETLVTNCKKYNKI